MVILMRIGLEAIQQLGISREAVIDDSVCFDFVAAFGSRRSGARLVFPNDFSHQIPNFGVKPQMATRHLDFGSVDGIRVRVIILLGMQSDDHLVWIVRGVDRHGVFVAQVFLDRLHDEAKQMLNVVCLFHVEDWLAIVLRILLCDPLVLSAEEVELFDHVAHKMAESVIPVLLLVFVLVLRQLLVDPEGEPTVGRIGQEGVHEG
mmetsp:Transcript_17241/g.47752  ORF Transcript_17241/g.47752 Transcript_17241/m.47752 type:complete len:204 (-) Transcript_17241:592-1203(-)